MNYSLVTAAFIFIAHRKNPQLVSHMQYFSFLFQGFNFEKSKWVCRYVKSTYACDTVSFPYYKRRYAASDDKLGATLYSSSTPIVATLLVNNTQHTSVIFTQTKKTLKSENNNKNAAL